MLDIILKILGILGIVILILFCVLVVLLLVVLFYPITYRVAAQKSESEITVRVKINWLFGLLRARFFYPEPGKFVVKLLWKTLYDSAAPKEEAQESSQGTKATDGAEDTNSANAGAETRNTGTEAGVTEVIKSTADADKPQMSSAEDAAAADTATDTAADTDRETPKKGIWESFTAKYEKIKYTILRIYDKIKHIWENFTFYRDLLQEEQTKELLQHAFYRLKKIFRNIRPRKLKADIVFGTGAPDTTGYVLGVYGMLSPMLGKHVNITPDFTQSILLGEFFAAGHITVFQVVFHSLMVVFDKRLKLLMGRIKKHRNQQT